VDASPALDAVECPPTFDVSARMVQFVIAGGPKALGAAVEADEDSRRTRPQSHRQKKPTRRDVVVALPPADALPSPSQPSSMRARTAQKLLPSFAIRGPRSAKQLMWLLSRRSAPKWSLAPRVWKAGTAAEDDSNMLTTGRDDGVSAMFTAT